MKVIARIFILIAGMLVALHASAQITTDAPHNAAVSMSCTDCHSQFSPGEYTDDVCLSCHTNATGGGYTKNSAPRMKTHASANTSDKYGVWSTTCISCHSQHNQAQLSAYGPAAHVVTGTVSSVTDNGNGTTTIGYMNQVTLLGEWGDYTKWGRKSTGGASGGNERGLILFANLADLGVSFEVLSATATDMTVQGSVDAAFPGRIAPGNTFALVYGQMANGNVSGRGVKFFQNSGPNSFAVNDGTPGGADPSPDGICQSCHTQTADWRSDGSFADHYSGENCTPCHRHEEGFRTNCEVCHNSPPQTGKHQTHVNGTIGYYGSTAVQSTSSAYGYGCGTCHRGTHLNSTANPRTVETIFAGVATRDGATAAAYTASTYTVDDPGTGYTFNYSNGTCANTYCHGNYPGSGRNSAATWSNGTASCGSCHGASNTDSPNSGSHVVHTFPSGHNYPCTLCHKNVVAGAGPGYSIADRSKHVNGFVDWQFDTADSRVSASTIYSIPSGSQMPSDGINSRTYGTCSNTYCHSIGQTPTGGPLTGAPGEYKTAERWGTPGNGSFYCGPCHKNGSHHNAGRPAAMDSGSHTKHLAYRFNTLTNSNGPSMKCAICHKYDAQASFNTCDSCHGLYSPQVYSHHVNGIVDVAIESAFGTATYNDTSPSPGAPGNGFFSCSNTYCHGDGTSVSTGLITANTSSVWGSGPLSCSSCHGNPPSYQNGSPKKNSHAAHAGESCSRCHITTTADGAAISSTVTHVNKKYDVSPQSVSGIAFTYTFSPTGGTCASISCHGGSSAQWGVTAVTCQSCHLGTADVDDFGGAFYNNGAISKIKGTGEWDTTGHGRAAGNYASGNPSAAFTVTNACLYCHDSAVGHKSAGNPFRLRNLADATWGKNGSCQACHAAGSTGVTVDSVLKNGTKKVGSTHYGAKHGAANSGGQFCWDCHDPHGDGNIFMMQAAVAKTSDSLTGAPLSTVSISFVTSVTGTSYAKSSPPFDGVCNVCHSSTSHYTATSGDGHNADARCTGCHSHSGGTFTEAFKPSCDACHGNPPVDNDTLVGFAVPSRTGSVTAGAHDKHVSTLKIGCNSCHANSVGNGTTHNNGDFNVTMGFSLFNGTYEGGVFDGQTVVSYNASAPSTTVTSSGLKKCSNIYCHGSTMAPNGGSDTSPVWDNPASVSCGSCHGVTAGSNPPLSGSHPRHSGDVISRNYAFDCTACHYGFTEIGGNHVNGKVDVTFNPDLGSQASSNADGIRVESGTFTAVCSNTYCHSNGSSVSTGTIASNTSPTWGSGTMACNGCHGTGTADGMPNYASGSPKANSHQKHVNQSSHPAPYNTSSWAFTMTCKTCHYGTTTDDATIASPRLHVNQSYDALTSNQRLPISGAGVSFTYTELPSGAQCFNVNCHRGATVYWGGSNGGTCSASSCHQSPYYGQTLVSISVTPSNPKAEMNGLQQFTATALYSNNVTQDVTLPAQWSSSNIAVASIDTGKYSHGLVKTGSVKGTTTITAWVGGISGSTTLEVTDVRLVSITVTPGNSLLPLGRTRQITATGSYSDNTVLDITNFVAWESSNAAVATIGGEGGSSGLAASVSEGSTTITARLGSVSGSTALTVTPPELASVAVTPLKQSLVIGDTQQFSAVGIYTDSSRRDLTGRVNWTSSNPAVAAIDGTGLATAVSGNTAIISATDPDASISGSTMLTVVALGGVVSPLYAVNGSNWNDYVKNDRSSIFGASDTACAGTETGGYTACLHGGEMRKVDVIGKSTCEGLSARDVLEAFDWTCDSSVNPVRMVSTGLKDGRTLSDLIDFSEIQWKRNNVVISYDGSPYSATSSAIWWSNPTAVSNSGGSLSTTGTIYVVTVNPSAGYQLRADKVSLITAPSVTLHTAAYSSYLIDATANPSYKFVWVEGNLDTSNNGDGTGGGSNFGLTLSNVNFSVLRNVRIASSMPHSGAYSLYLYKSSNNKVTGFSSDRGYEGIYLYASSNNTFSDITIDRHQDGILLTGGSNNNAFTQVSASGNSTGFSIQSAYNSFMRIRAANSLGGGINLTGSYNIFKNAVVSNNGGKAGNTGSYGISIRGVNNKLLNVEVFNNSWSGIVLNNASDNVLANVTTSNNWADGIYLTSSGFNVLVNVTTASNGRGGLGFYLSNSNVIENLAAANNGGYGIEIKSSSYNYFTGLLKTGNNYFGDCSTSGSEPGLVNGTCANNGASNASLTTGITLASSFAGKAASDSVNMNGRAGTAPYNSLTDWTGFESANRGWGVDSLSAFPSGGNRGTCSTNLTCRIWDWSLLPADTIIKGIVPKKASGNAADAITVYWYVNPAPTNQASCSAAVPGSYFFSYSCMNIFLRDAVEISGNGNGLCESYETCLYTPNVGADQGQGDLISAGSFTNGGSLAGITLLTYGP